MKSLICSFRVVVATMLVCVAGYTALVLAFAQALTPETAEGSLVKHRDGTVIGSRLIAQKFAKADYFWPRPSAVDYNASSAGGSNKSPTSSALTERATQLVQQYGASAQRPLPPELAAASGGGLDPHISEHAALYQAERVAKARHLPQTQVEAIIRDRAFAPGAFVTAGRLVNVLELNLALDDLKAAAQH
jgi:K+-transporting ATPase ATPase C chain